MFYVTCRMCDVDKDIELMDAGLWWMHTETRVNWQTKGQAMFHAAIVRMEQDPYYVGMLEKVTLNVAPLYYSQKEIDWHLKDGWQDHDWVNDHPPYGPDTLIARLCNIVKQEITGFDLL